MASARTQQRRATTPQRGRVQRPAQPGRRFTRSAPASGRSGMPGRRRQPEQSRAEKVIGLVRGALPGGGSRTKKKGSAIPVVGGLLGGMKGRRAGGRKPALLGLLGAGAAGAAVAAKRRKGSDSRRATTETRPVPETQTASTPPPAVDDPASGSAG
jgi:hypothetical protein